MIKYNLQLFGGNGAGGGESLGNGGGGNVNVINEEDIWQYREQSGNNEPFVDQINGAFADIQNTFPDITNTVSIINAAELGGNDKYNVLGFFSRGDKSVSLNTNYTDIGRMNTAYDQAIKDGYHPSRGNKTGVEAVTYHELGHGLTYHVAQKMGARSFDTAAKKIVNDAYKNSNSKGGTKAFANKISGYAAESYSECIAEAVADYFCNGSKAQSNSKAIVAELRKY